MSVVPHPHLDHFLSTFQEERTWAQVIVRRFPPGFELRHIADRNADAATLREVAMKDLRTLAQTNGRGAFRPLLGAPDLVGGWRCVVREPSELAAALDRLYPGSLADWWASLTGAAHPIHFGEIAARRQGRSGATLRRLPSHSLAAAIHAGCGPSSCLKQRRWSASEAPPDEGWEKSILPCLEPCPVLLVFAQACAQTELSPTVGVELAPDDLITLAAALRHAQAHPPPDLGAADFGVPLHPWRVACLLERHVDLWNRTPAPDLESHAES